MPRKSLGIIAGIVAMTIAWYCFNQLNIGDGIARADEPSLFAEPIKQELSYSRNQLNQHSITENNEKCHWLVGRLDKLEHVISQEGLGDNSQFCEEFDLRRRELKTNHCLADNNVKYQRTC